MSDSSFKFEGILGAPLTNINNLNQHAQAFLPYNPTIIEVGAYEGAGTVSLAQTYPHGRVFACEPNPRAFAVLEQRLEKCRHATSVNVAVGTSNGIANLYVPSADDAMSASLLPPRRDPEHRLDQASVRVSVVVLDDWCRQQGLARAEFVRLDAGGFELQILQSSPHTVKTALVIVTRTHFDRPSTSVISYSVLKFFMEMMGFELLSHWYQERFQGEATFVRKALYDSIFR
jgi:FkbM family methyltransferase